MPRLGVFAFAFLALAPCSHGQNVPRPEHPEPMAVRPHWSNLNGTWQFRFDLDDSGTKSNWFEPNEAGFDRSIVVPFGWESELSGIAESKGAPKVGWYRRTFRVPADFPPDQGVWLRFQAVDWRADVWVNGRKVAEHEGGYTPFAADISNEIVRDKENTLVVRAFDPTDASLPTGKQIGWYTPTSGIWQTVWLEARPRDYVRDFQIETSFEKSEARVRVHPVVGDARTYSLALKTEDPTVKVPAPVAFSGPKADGLDLIAPINQPKPWSPESPHLYDLVIELRDQDGKVVDSVSTYFGLRTITRGKVPGEDFERVFLNGKPIYLRGALDQSFNPKGVYTAPSDDFLMKDINLAKASGLNFLRIHIKPDEPRRLYWADKLGMMIMEDMPNSWEQNPRARLAWESTMREVLARDRNHPSIFSWVAFNETWGLGPRRNFHEYKNDKDTQEWVRRMVGAMKVIDPTRLIEDNSPCHYDHVETTDLNSWHFYIDDHEQARRHIDEVVNRSVVGSDFNYCPGLTMNSAPLINSEYGAVSAGGGDRDVSWGFRDLTTLLRKQPRIQGYIYTELTDIEWEHNGFADYDRSAKVFGYDAFVPGMTVADLQGADFVGYDGPPVIVAKPGEVIRVPWFVSHYSTRTEPPTLRWWITGFDDDGVKDEITPQERPVEWTPYGVTKQPKEIAFRIKGPWVGALAMELVDRNGKRLAANFVNVVVQPERPRARVERLDEHHAAIRFKPDEFSKKKWQGATARQPSGKVQGLGAGYFEYRLKLPEAVAKAGPESVELLLEVSSRAGREQVDWAERVNAQDNPQTDARKWPTDLLVRINGEAVASTELDDDPADARGVLSHLARTDHGSHGELLRLSVRLPQKIREELAGGKPLVLQLSVPDDGDHQGGLAVFGATTGRYPFDPTVTITTGQELPADLGVDKDKSAAIETAASRVRSLLLSGGGSGNSATWSYTTTKPDGSWTRPDFDASSWKAGRGGFGTEGTPAVRVGTTWNTPDIWMRTSFDMPGAVSTDDSLSLHLFHDEDVEVFLDGQPLFQARGYVTAYSDIEVTGARLALFTPGRHVIAAHCRQTGGGQGIDLGLRWVRSSE